MLRRHVALFPKCFILLFLVWGLIDWDPITWYYKIQRWETVKVLKQWRWSTNQAFRNIYLRKCGISENTEQLFSSIVRVSIPSNYLFTAISNKIIYGNGYTPIYEKSCTELSGSSDGFSENIAAYIHHEKVTKCTKIPERMKEIAMWWWGLWGMFIYIHHVVVIWSDCCGPVM